jgi:hypothetical protein
MFCGGEIGETKMPQREDRWAYVLLRAYALAATGAHHSYLTIVRTLVKEGYPEAAAWLNQEHVCKALNEICCE